VIGELRRMRRGRDAGRLVDVLVGEGDAVQPAAPRPRHLPRLGRARILQRPLAGDADEGVQAGIERLDAR
jgi:hypothetical protein